MSAITKHIIRSSINFVDEILGLRKLMSEGAIEATHPLEGDRAIEWSWIVENLPKNSVNILDLGCVQSPLTGIASRLGHKVTAVDMRDIEYEMNNVTFINGDISNIDFCDKCFDIIMNCSMIEHVGLAGRYGSVETNDGDLSVMRLLKTLLTPTGLMLLTIPVGKDAIFSPHHRIYGEMTLPTLLNDYSILKEEFWRKGSSKKWKVCDKKSALSENGTKNFYALGLFVLRTK